MKGICKMSFSKEIRIIRQKAFLTQEDFAKEINVSFATVNRWEAGKTRPEISSMKKIKQFCNDNNLSFDNLQNAWLSMSEEGK
jgi:DNA-binding transcriptional regulator YiaG